jgi:predicted FMN-binding regulatory protein PaiB
MYVPRHFVEADQSFIRDFVRKYNFGLLVTWNGRRPLATQLLFSLKESGSDAVLLGHMARSNPQWRTFEQTPEALAVFEGFKIRRVYDEARGLWYFSVVDVVAALLGQTDHQAARNYWKVLKNRLNKEGSQTVTNCNRLKKMGANCRQIVDS